MRSDGVNNFDASITVLETDGIRKQLLRQFQKPQKSITLVSPFVQDADLGNFKALKVLFEIQQRGDTEITLFTTPPSMSRAKEFRRKYNLLKEFRKFTSAILLNNKLHAKVYSFNSGDSLFITIIGSANFTTQALNERLEIAVLTNKSSVYHSTSALVSMFKNKIQGTLEFETWERQNWVKINQLKGAKI